MPLHRRYGNSSPTSSDDEADYHKGRGASPVSRGRRAVSLNPPRRPDYDTKQSYHRPSSERRYYSDDDDDDDDGNDDNDRDDERDHHRRGHSKHRSTRSSRASSYSPSRDRHQSSTRSRSVDEHGHRHHRRDSSPRRHHSKDHDHDGRPRTRSVAPFSSSRYDSYDDDPRSRRRTASEAPRSRHHHHHHHHHHHQRSPSPSSRSHHRRSSSPTSHKSKSRDRSRHYPPSSSRSNNLPRKSKTFPEPKFPKPRRSSTDLLLGAGRCAFEAGAMAALKMKDDPSPWLGPKGAKVAAAALSAAAVDTFMEQKHPKRKGGLVHTAMRQVTQLAIGSMVKPGLQEVGKRGGKAGDRMKEGVKGRVHGRHRR